MRIWKFCDEIATKRGDKKIELIHNGDAIDGDHHQSGDVCTLNPLEQADIHIELMTELQRRIGWRRGDELYYTRGTQVHVIEFETYIGKQLNAVPDGGFLYGIYSNCIPMARCLGLSTMDQGRAKGANRGNPVQAWLKNIYYDALNDQRNAPDIVYTGHVHDQRTISCIPWENGIQDHARCNTAIVAG